MEESEHKTGSPATSAIPIRGPVRNFPPSPDSSKRAFGIPPAHPHFSPPPPYLQIPNPSHSRSSSQPPFFSLDSASASASVSVSASPPSDFAAAARDPARSAKSHRRSRSDTPFDSRLAGAGAAGLPPLPQSYSLSPREGKPPKQETEWDHRDRDGSVERRSDGDAAADDLFSAYMNLDSLDTLNSSGAKTNNSSDNEAESSVSMGNKRGAGHGRSLSMDSFIGGMSFGEESPKLLPSPGSAGSFSLEFGSGEFSGAELKKIMANEKLSEIAMTDPKRAKRILANRQSAARSKERKMRYISELEHKVQTLQTEATTLSAQLTMLQRDSAGLTNQNNEFKFRLQAMEQQAHLKDALNEALTAEVQRLKRVAGESQLANSLNQQMQLNPQMFQMQQQQQQQQQVQKQPHQQHQKNGEASKHDSSK